MSDPFERPVKVETLIAMLQSVSKRLDYARVTVSDDKRFLVITGKGAHRASICLVADVFDEEIG